MRHVTRARVAAVVGASAAALALAMLFSLSLGPSQLGLADLLTALRAGPDAAGAGSDILWRIRLPRTLLAAVVGAALATSGAVFQALLRNPLADPYILGVSGGAALGGVSAIALGGAWLPFALTVPAAAFAGGVIATLLLFAVAGGAGRAHPTQLLLTGVVFNALASAAIVFLASVAGLTEGSRIFLWLIGSLSAVRGASAGVLLVCVSGGVALALALARGLDALALGEDAARQLGVATERQRRWLLAATSLMVAAAVSAAGLVGFVGLIVPHGLRLAIGPDHRLLLPAAALGGGAFLVVCDALARSLLGGRELPVGAITALVGGPLFLLLLSRQRLPGAPR